MLTLVKESIPKLGRLKGRAKILEPIINSFWAEFWHLREMLFAISAVKSSDRQQPARIQDQLTTQARNSNKYCVEESRIRFINFVLPV